MKYLVNYFSKGELALWAGSVTAVLAAFLMFDRSSWINASGFADRGDVADIRS